MAGPEVLGKGQVHRLMSQLFVGGIAGSFPIRRPSSEQQQVVGEPTPSRGNLLFFWWQWSWLDSFSHGPDSRFQVWRGRLHLHVFVKIEVK